jgi:hypothetical protein
MHPEAHRYIARLVRRMPTPRRVIEIGGYRVNGSVRELFAGAAYTAIDVRPGPGVDVVADGATWRPDEPVDCVVCCEVLEHAPDAGRIVANAREMLIDGGVLIVTAAAPERAPHGCDGGPVGGEFYRAVTAEDLRGWLSGFSSSDVEHDPERGDVYGWGIR